MPKKKKPKKPSLEITEWIDKVPTKARCSECKDVVFVTIGQMRGAEEQMRNFSEKFQAHLKDRHAREDVSQAAFRVVREATEKD